MDEFFLHPSSFPQFEDCEKRAAARLFSRVIRDGGFELRATGSSIGAAVGTGTHAAVGHMLSVKLKTGELGDIDAATETGIASMTERLNSDEVIWDETTRDLDTAQKQLVRMTRSYRKFVAPEFEPVTVEERLESDIGGGFILTGQTDQVVAEKSGIRDLKTGVIRRVNVSQYGAYSILNKIHGRPVGAIGEDFVQRVRLNRPQPEPVHEAYDVRICEQSALRVIAFIKAGLKEFRARLRVNADPPEDAFRSNPNSVLCSPKYCPAHGTAFCRIHRGAR